MKTLTCDITIGEWNFDFVTNIEIVSTWDTLVDTCKIEIPRNVTFKRDGNILTDYIGGDNPVFNIRDIVTVNLGYDGVLKNRFVGRLASVIPSKPLTLLCEDEMWIFKQSYIKKITFKNTSLEAVIQGLLDVAEGEAGFLLIEAFDIQDISITGELKFTDTTIAKVFDFLRKKLGIITYFRNQIDSEGEPEIKFVSGLAYTTEDLLNSPIKKSVSSDGKAAFESSTAEIEEQLTTVFQYGANIIDDDGLEYKTGDEKILVIGESSQINKKSSFVTATAGDEGGDVVKIRYPNLTQEELQLFVDERLSHSKFEGFSGSFNAFLEPIVKHGQTVRIINKPTPEKEGVYLIKKVVTQFGTGGGRQEIFLDAKVQDA